MCVDDDSICMYIIIISFFIVNKLQSSFKINHKLIKANFAAAQMPMQIP